MYEKENPHLRDPYQKVLDKMDEEQVLAAMQEVRDSPVIVRKRQAEAEEGSAREETVATGEEFGG